MDAQRLIVMAVIGIVAGWLASLFVGGLRAGLVGYLVAGLIGSVVGGWLLGQLGVRFNAGNPIVDSIITSTIGAIVVIVLARLLGI
jgi:uncharacterized membrane protein YeaQ/YmgE (transglycosylase-associated protein family)